MREFLVSGPVAAKLIGKSAIWLREEGWLPTIVIDGRVLYSMDTLGQIFGFKASKIEIERARLDAIRI